MAKIHKNKIAIKNEKKHLLFICNLNQSRSPAAQALFSNNNEYEAKSAGLSALSEVEISSQAVQWADFIFVMDEFKELQKTLLIKRFPKSSKKPIIVLNIPNSFSKNDAQLERILRIQLEREGFVP